MATQLENMTRLGGIDELGAALGGAPLPQPVPGEDEKEARKRRKRESRLRQDAQRPPDSFERFRILSELVKEGRQVIEMADHRARYSLVVMGVLNAGVFSLMSRSHLFGGVSYAAKPWLIGFLVVYAALSFLFVYYAADCLRPRQLGYGHTMAFSGDGHLPRGVLYWETIATYDLDAYRRAWSGVRMEQLNAEVVVIAHTMSRLIRIKYVALGRLYVGMAALALLAGALLAVITFFGVVA